MAAGSPAESGKAIREARIKAVQAMAKVAERTGQRILDLQQQFADADFAFERARFKFRLQVGSDDTARPVREEHSDTGEI